MRPDVAWAPGYTAMLACSGGRCLSTAGDKLSIHGREFVTEVADQGI
jgi:hypothetical protein